MKRTITLSAAGLAAAALLTGCTGTPTATPAAGGTSTSTSTSISAPTTATSSTVTKTDTVTLIKQMTNGQKNLKYYTSNSESNFKYGKVASTTKGVTVVDNTNPDKPKMQMTNDTSMDMGTGTPQKSQTITVFDGDTLYTKEPDGSWSKTDTAALGASLASAAPTPTANPDEYAQKIADLIKEPTLVGDETVNGMPTKHYRFTVNMSQLFGTVMGQGASASAQPSASSDGSEMTTNDYWLNADGVPIKSTTSSKMGTSTTVLSKLNEPVKIDIPTNATTKPMPSYPGMPTTKK